MVPPLDEQHTQHHQFSTVSVCFRAQKLLWKKRVTEMAIPQKRNNEAEGLFLNRMVNENSESDGTSIRKQNQDENTPHEFQWTRD